MHLLLSQWTAFWLVVFKTNHCSRQSDAPHLNFYYVFCSKHTLQVKIGTRLATFTFLFFFFHFLFYFHCILFSSHSSLKYQTYISVYLLYTLHLSVWNSPKIMRTKCMYCTVIIHMQRAVSFGKEMSEYNKERFICLHLYTFKHVCLLLFQAAFLTEMLRKVIIHNKGAREVFKWISSKAEYFPILSYR